MKLSAIGLSVVVVFSLDLSPSVATAARSPNYSKIILGCWLGSRKFEVYHADGTWGVKRNEDAIEDTEGRRWHIKGNKLTVTYPGDHGLSTYVYTIVSCTAHSLILSGDGEKEELTRYSADCHTGT